MKLLVADDKISIGKGVNFLDSPKKAVYNKRSFEQEEVEIMAQRYKKSQIKILEQKLANMFRSQVEDPLMVQMVSQEIGFLLESKYLCVAVSFMKQKYYADEAVNIIHKFYSSFFHYCLCTYLEEGVYLVILEHNKNLKKEAVEKSKILTQVYPNMQIGLGTKVMDYLQIYNSTKEAVEALKYRFFHNKEQMFLYSPVRNQRRLGSDLYHDFIQVIKNPQTDLKIWINKVFDELIDMQALDENRIKSLFCSISDELIGDNINLLKQKIYQQDEMEQKIWQAESIYGLKMIMNNIVDFYINRYKYKEKYSKLVRDIREYIKNHCEDVFLGVEEVALQMHFSASYLNVLFKEEVGITIKQYIVSYRIEHSKNILKTKNYKVNEVARLCGYSNANYFAKAFKAETNMTPLEYRRLKA